jgi:hypothetical protein
MDTKKKAKKTPTKPVKKRGRGRPFLGDAGKTVTLTIKLSKLEIAAWTARAEKEGTTLRGLLGRVIREALGGK